MPTALIVEDEPLLRKELRHHLSVLWPELEIAGEAENGVDAVRQIETLAPDIVFLDIQIPGLNGLEVAEHLPDSTRVVFVTAYAEHAVRAFETGAADYIVKPIVASRLLQTIKRLKTRGSGTAKPADTVWQQAFGNAQAGYLKWIKASLADTVRLIMVEEVQFFQSDGKYTRVVTQAEEALIRLPLKSLLEQLDPSQFAQIHRSTIVNLHAIESIKKIDGATEIRLKGRKEILAVSEAFSRQFRQM